jgi:hypothetical protein
MFGKYSRQRDRNDHENKGRLKPNKRKQEDVFGGGHVCKLMCLTHLFDDV